MDSDENRDSNGPSGFGFMSASDNRDANATEDASVSGFGFMSPATPVEDGSEGEREAPVSGFDFMSSSVEESATVEEDILAELDLENQPSLPSRQRLLSTDSTRRLSMDSLPDMSGEFSLSNEFSFLKDPAIIASASEAQATPEPETSEVSLLSVNNVTNMSNGSSAAPTPAAAAANVVDLLDEAPSALPVIQFKTATAKPGKKKRSSVAKIGFGRNAAPTAADAMEVVKEEAPAVVNVPVTVEEPVTPPVVVTQEVAPEAAIEKVEPVAAPAPVSPTYSLATFTGSAPADEHIRQRTRTSSNVTASSVPAPSEVEPAPVDTAQQPSEEPSLDKTPPKPAGFLSRMWGRSANPSPAAAASSTPPPASVPVPAQRRDSKPAAAAPVWGAKSPGSTPTPVAAEAPAPVQRRDSKPAQLPHGVVKSAPQEVKEVVDKSPTSATAVTSTSSPRASLSVPTPNASVPEPEEGSMFSFLNTPTAAPAESSPHESPIAALPPKAEVFLTQHKIATVVDSFNDMTLTSFHERSSILTEKKELLLKKERLIAENRSNVRKLAEAEADQQKFAVMEEFEKADIMSSVIDDLGKKTLMFPRELDELDRMYQQLIQSSSEFHAKLVHGWEASSRELHECVELQEKESHALSSDDKAALAREGARLVSEEQRAALEIAQVKREEHSLFEECEITENAIKDQTSLELETKNELAGKIDAVSAEIKELEKVLADKKAEDRKHRAELDAVEARILSVRKKYDRKLSRLEDRKAILAVTQTECIADAAAVALDRKTYEKEVRSSEMKLLRIEWWKNTVSADIHMGELLKEALTYAMKSDEDYELQNASKNEGNEELQKAFQLAESNWLEETSKESSARACIAELASEISDIDEKLPKMEADKKCHASARRFKEAAAAAKDIKTLISRKSDVESEMEELSESLETMRSAIEAALKEVSLAKEAITQSEKATDLVVLDCTRHKLTSVRMVAHTLQKLIAESEPCPMDDGLEADDQDILSQAGWHLTFQDTVASIIEAEIEELEDGITVLCDKHALNSADFIVVLEVDESAGEGEEGRDVAAAGGDACAVAEDTIVTTAEDNTHTSEDTTSEVVEVSEEEAVEQQQQREKEIESLQATLAEAREAIDVATEEEDYDKAAELDEQIEGLVNSLVALGVIEGEM